MHIRKQMQFSPCTKKRENKKLSQIRQLIEYLRKENS